MDPIEILNFWEKTYGNLTPELKESFLKKTELNELINLPDEIVKKSIQNSKKLESALQEAKNLLLGETRCENHQLEKCPICTGSKEDLKKSVYATEKTVLVFHERKNCSSLLEGQRRVKRHGKTPSRVMTLTVQQAKRRGLSPCQTCIPKEK